MEKTFTFTISINDRLYTVRVGDVGQTPVLIKVDGHVFEVDLVQGVPQRPRPVSGVSSQGR